MTSFVRPILAILLILSLSGCSHLPWIDFWSNEPSSPTGPETEDILVIPDRPSPSPTPPGKSVDKSSTKPPTRRNRSKTASFKILDEAQVLDHSLRRKVEPLLTYSKRLPDQNLQAIVLLHCKHHRPMQVEVRGRFFDMHRVELDDPTPWRKVPLAPHSVTLAAVSSTTPELGAYYSIEVRRVRKPEKEKP